MKSFLEKNEQDLYYQRLVSDLGGRETPGSFPWRLARWLWEDSKTQTFHSLPQDEKDRMWRSDIHRHTYQALALRLLTWMDENQRGPRWERRKGGWDFLIGYSVGMVVVTACYVLFHRLGCG